MTFAAKALSDDTFVSDAEDVVIWSGTVRANNVEDLYIRRIGFVNNGGTATTSDVDDFSFWKKKEIPLPQLKHVQIRHRQWMLYSQLLMKTEGEWTSCSCRR